MVSEEFNHPSRLKSDRAHVVGDKITTEAGFNRGGLQKDGSLPELLFQEASGLLLSKSEVALDVRPCEDLDSVGFVLNLFLALPFADCEDLTNATAETCFIPIGFSVTEAKANVPALLMGLHKLEVGTAIGQDQAVSVPQAEHSFTLACNRQ